MFADVCIPDRGTAVGTKRSGTLETADLLWRLGGILGVRKLYQMQGLPKLMLVFWLKGPSTP